MAVPTRAMFVLGDLHKKENMGMVMSNLKALSDISHRFGCTVAPIPEKSHAKPNTDSKKIWEVEAAAAGAVLAVESDEEIDVLDKEIAITTKKLDELRGKVRGMDGKLTREKNQMKREETKVIDARKDVTVLRQRGKGGNHGQLDGLTQSLWDAREQVDIIQDKIDFPDPESEEAKLQKAIEEVKKQSDTQRVKGDKDIARTKNEHTTKMAEYNQQISTLEVDAAAVVSTLTELRQQVKVMEAEELKCMEERDMLESRLQELEAEHAGKIEALKQESAAVAAQIQAVATARAAVEQEMSQKSKQDQAEEEAKRKKLEARQDVLDKEFKALRAQLQQEMSAETKDLRDQIDSQKSIVNGLEKQLQAHKKQALDATANLSKKVTQLEREIQTLNAELEAKENALNADIATIKQKTQDSVNGRATRLENLKQTKANQKNEQETAKADLETKVVQEQDLADKEVAKLNTQAKEIKQTVEKKQQQYDEFTAKLTDELQALRVKTQEQAATYNTNIATSKKERESVVTANQTERAALQHQLDGQKTQLKGVQDSYRTKVKALEKETLDLEATKAQEIRSTTQSHSEAIAALKHTIDDQKALISQFELNIVQVSEGGDSMLEKVTAQHQQSLKEIQDSTNEQANLVSENEKMREHQKVKFQQLQEANTVLEETLIELGEQLDRQMELLNQQSEEHKNTIFAEVARIQEESAAQVAALQQEYIDLETVQTELAAEHREQVKALNQEINDTRQQLDNDISELYNTVAVEERFIADLIGGNSEELEMADNEIALLRHKIEAIDASLEVHIKEFELQSLKVGQSNDEKIRQAQEELAIQQEIFSEQAKALEQQKIGLEDEIQQRESDLLTVGAELQQKRDQLQQHLIDQLGSKDELEIKREELQVQFEQQSRLIETEASISLEETSALLEDLATSQHQLTQRITSLKSSIQTALEKFEDEYNQLHDQNQKAVKNLQYISQRQKDKLNERQTLHHNITHMESELDLIQAAFGEVQVVALEKETEKEVLEAKLQKQEAKGAGIQASLTALKSENRRLKEMWQEIADHLEQTRQQFKDEMTKTLAKFMMTDVIVDIPGLVQNFKEGFQDNENRREFTALLDEYAERPNQGSVFMIPQNSFHGVGVLTGLVLGGLNLSSMKDEGEGMADYVTAKLLLQMSNKIKFVEDGEEEFFTSLIKSHRCWDTLAFWEKYFSETVPVQFVAHFPDQEVGNYTSEAINWLVRQVTTFAYSMAGWGHLTEDQITKCTINATETRLIQELGLDVERTELMTKIQHTLSRQPPVPPKKREITRRPSVNLIGGATPRPSVGPPGGATPRPAPQTRPSLGNLGALGLGDWGMGTTPRQPAAGTGQPSTTPRSSGATPRSKTSLFRDKTVNKDKDKK